MKTGEESANNRYDDTADDVAAAYKEVMARTFGDDEGEPAPKPAKAHVESAAAPQAPEGDEGEEPADDGVKRDKGRFVKGSKPPPRKADSSANGDGAEHEGEQPVETPAKAPEAPAGGPPSSWGIKSKAAWQALPEDVRNDIIKREGEVAQGLSALRDFKDLKPWAEKASAAGTTISKALESYVGLENLLKQDPKQGLVQIARNLGMQPAQIGQLFAELAQKHGAAATGSSVPGGTGGGAAHPLPGQSEDPLIAALAPVLKPLQDKLGTLETHFTRQQEAVRTQQQQGLRSAIETFRADPANIYFDNLEDSIANLFEKGMITRTGDHMADLKSAYDLAANMNPEIREALIEQRLREQGDVQRKAEQERVAKAKSASRSLTGSRMPGSTVVTPREEGMSASDDIEADVRRAYSALAQS